jgi:hypothetical protein
VAGLDQRGLQMTIQVFVDLILNQFFQTFSLANSAPYAIAARTSSGLSDG